MTDKHTPILSPDDWDEKHYPRAEETGFDQVVAAAMSRRGFLSGVLTVGSGAAVMGAWPSLADAGSGRLPFAAIPTFTDGTVHVPEGYKWSVVAKWGEPLFADAPAFDAVKGHPSEGADRVFGENTDGMELFAVGDRQVIAVNHEYANIDTNLAETGEVTSAADVSLLQAIQGVTVMEVAQGAEGWGIVVDSPMNRRITHNTEMEITGPAAGHELLQTEADPTGTLSLGTMNNCGAGKTPWGTYLTCEENFNGYFGSTDELIDLPEDYARYGIGLEGWGYNYHQHDPRFDVSQNPAEPRRAGWIVEIDPSDPSSTPKKRTGLGRFKHENAAVALAEDGRVVVYLGDDERGEFLYRFVSRDSYAPGGDTDTLLNEGQLAVARFDDDGTGTWVDLTPEATGMADDAEIAIFARMAASAVGATTMDRPEWVAVNPHAVEAYCALTNNKNRGIKPNAGGDETPVNGPNPREANKYGQIVRWRPQGDDHTARRFSWDLYVMAGNPAVHSNANAGSVNVHEGNLFNSPDGMQFDSAGILWIQTDGNDSDEGDFAGMGNNQMLAGDPASGRIARFLTGPRGAEVTGLTWSADRRTMFVGIQHPDAPFPDGPDSLPRSSIVAVWRDDGAPVG